jgi:NAD(P)H-dependent flavin oxidoreductase YrpB (nitropropane dioxygenase family)
MRSGESAGGPSKVSRRRMLGLLGAGGMAAVAAGGQVFGKEGTVNMEQKSVSLDTRLTREYGVRYPLVCAGMAFVGTAPLAAAVANAGGVGMLGAGPEAPEGVLNLIDQTRALTGELFGVNFIVDETRFGPMTTDDHVKVCAAKGVRVVSFHWNPPERRWVEWLHAAGAKVWFQTGLVEQARAAVEVGVDALVAQGGEAGGHVRAEAGTLRTLEDIRDAVPASTLVLAAGGIADGRDVARALKNGADGVWIGTRFVASAESNAHDEYKRRLVEARGRATEHTTLFGPEWPAQRIQVLRNRVVAEWAGREDEIPTPPPPPDFIGSTRLMPNSVPDGGLPYEMPKFSAMLPTPATTGDFEEMCMPAGAGVKFIREIKPAAEIVAELMEEAAKAVNRES